MEIIYTDGSNPDFIMLCHMLDDYLNQIVGCEEDRLQYIKYNTLEDIHDVIIAYDDNIPIGCASFKLYENDIAEVKRVFVKEEYRGKGISKELLQHVESSAKEKRYKKLGYTKIDNYGQYKCMKDSICMSKTLVRDAT